jgi:hypothetical protein
LQSGIYIPGNGKGLVKLLGPSGNYLVAASQNRDALKLFSLKKKTGCLRVNPDDMSALIRFKNGNIQKEEFYYGSSFLSQSARFLNTDSSVVSLTIVNRKGQRRVVLPPPGK